MKPASHAVAAVVALIGSTAAQQLVQRGGWTRINRCTSGASDGYINNVEYYAQHATQVKICSLGADVSSESECVTSRPNTFPIINLREGESLLSHISGQVPCNSYCVGQTWMGQRLNQLWTTCYPANAENPVYHACNNGNGIHWTIDTRRDPPLPICGWTASPGNPQAGGLEVFINFQTPAPTAVPTSAPTGWFEAPDHRENITELQSTVVALAEQVRTLQQQLAQKANVAYVDQLVSSVQQTSALNAASIGALEGADIEIMANLTAVQNVQRALKDAVDSASSSATTAPDSASVEANGDRVVINSPGTVGVAAGQCVVDDLCGASAFAQRIRDALRASQQ